MQQVGGRSVSRCCRRSRSGTGRRFRADGRRAAAMVAGFHRSFLIGATLLVVLLVLALFLPPLREEVDTEALAAG